MLSLEQLVEEISKKSGSGPDKVKKLISEKQDELSGLVSEEGAAYIVGRELGVELIKETNRTLKVSSILPGMRSVELVAKIMNVYDIREFESKGKKGKVASIVLADETGSIRLPFWNEETMLIAEKGLSENDVVKISGAWAKKDNQNGTELRLTRKSDISKLEGNDAPDIQAAAPARQQPGTQTSAPERTDIKSLRPGMNAIVRGALLQVYRRKPYYEACPQCGSRAQEKEGKFVCKEHGEVEPAYNLMLAGVIDDGTENIRVVMFREQAEKVFGMSPEEVKSAFSKTEMDFWEDFPNLGKEFMIEGRVKTNSFSNEPELIASNVMDVSVKEECNRLLKSIGS